jgi:hypothetical protein
MALIANMTLSSGSMVAGQSPAPQATLTVYNPNASAVLVSGARVSISTASGQQTHAGNAPTVPLIAGYSTVPALSSLTFGPFPVAIGSAASGNAFQMVPDAVRRARWVDIGPMSIAAVIAGIFAVRALVKRP